AEPAEVTKPATTADRKPDGSADDRRPPRSCAAIVKENGKTCSGRDRYKVCY
ncbi:MAG: hypothetical protein HC850_18055, partial [Rhodomicrobium sp.]|nr:hypothetical protein [Rhodomicrobium sp.]